MEEDNKKLKDNSNKCEIELEKINLLLSAVKTERDRLSFIVNSIPDEVWFADLNKNFVLVNPSALKSFKLEEIGNLNVENFAKSLEVFRPDGSPRPVEEAPPIRALAGEIVIKQEEVVRLPVSGDLRYREVNSSPVRDDKGSIIGAVSIVRDITQRKILEDKLRVARSQYETLVESGNDGIIVIQNGATLKYVNLVMTKLLGYSRDEVVGRPFLEFVPPEYKKIVADRYEKRVAGQETPTRYEVELLSKDKTKKWVEINASKITYEGEPAVMAIIRDITENKKIREEILRGKTRLDLALGSAHMGVWQFDATSKKRIFDEQTCRLLGIDIKTFNGSAEQFYKVVHPDDLERIKAALNNTLEHGVIYELEYRIIWPDGTIRYVAVKGELIRDNDSKLNIVIGIIWDITERKKIEDLLRDSEEKYKILFSRMMNGFALHKIITNEQGKPIDYEFIEINDTFEKMTGIKRSDALGKMVTAVIPGIENEPANWIGIYGDVAINGKEIKFENHSETLKKWFSISAYSPKKGYFATIFEDITKRKQTEIELDRKKNELEQAFKELKTINKLKDDFLSTTAHELRAPLTPIKSQAQLLLAGEYGELNEEQRNAIEMILKNEDGLDKISNDTIDIVKIKSGKFEPIIEETNLSKILDGVVSEIRLISNGREISVSISPFSEITKILAEGRRIEQVLRNILVNAVKFTSKEGKISVEVKKINNEVVVSVKDNGIGIEKKNIVKLFEPFYQVESEITRKYGGTGLGLAVSRGIIEAHNGRIWVESEGLGKGSTFSFTLPIK